MLEVIGLKKKFGDNNVFENLNLTIDKGEITVVVGRSGEGKTTLLRCIAALERCDYGTIKINNEELCKEGIYKEGRELKEIRRNIGVVFQNFNLFPHMTVLENIIEAPIKVLKLQKDEARRRGLLILKSLSMEDKKDNYPNELSGGQKQRVAIARALAMEPRVLCFDEPTSALDPKTTIEVSEIIKDLGAKGISIMIITHDISFANNVADRVMKLENGKLKVEEPS
ncbi:MAG: amino acid ABC transporter ATP-binding protein [Clostridium sp.]